MVLKTLKGLYTFLSHDQRVSKAKLQLQDPSGVDHIYEVWEHGFGGTGNWWGHHRPRWFW